MARGGEKSPAGWSARSPRRVQAVARPEVQARVQASGPRQGGAVVAGRGAQAASVMATRTASRVLVLVLVLVLGARGYDEGR